MKRFSYKAKSIDGKEVKGEVEASTIEAAAKLIKSKGLVVISIKPAGSILDIFGSLRDRITNDDITTFTRQLATMVNAGLPLTESLLILRAQSKGNMQKMVAQVLASVEGGESFSAALAKFPKVFTPTYIALVKAGELGGVLDDVLVRLADNMEREQEFKGKVKGVLIYPVIVVVGMVGVMAVMMIFVVPKLLGFYSQFNAQLPLPTKILIGLSDFSVKAWPLILLGLIVLIMLFINYRKTEVGKKQIDTLIFKLPIIGPLQQQIMLTELTRTLSMMVGAGVSILEGLNITSEVMGNAVLADALEDSAKQVEKGFPIAYSFARHPEAFPYILSQMVAVGEETGKMEEVLKKVSHIFEIESDQKVKALTTAVEPIIMVILGIGVGFLVIAVILPIYNLTSSF
ncbi:type II secretion system F family protein [Candidatus Woesebacteria bacterium]|nr:type II secretion system F family protein [Candidatus Woesebacteria bacterium]